jgi:ferritin
MVEGRLISDELAQALNEQIGHEFAASLQYVSISSYFAGANLFVLAKLFQEQSDEERGHALKLTDYLVRAGVGVQIPAIAETRSNFASAEEAVSLALEWELEVSTQFNRLMDMSVRLNDYLAQEFLGWFVTEQLEEVWKMRRILDVIRRAGSNLLMIEAYLAHNDSGLSS